jgi:subtilisin family serine protease
MNAIELVRLPPLMTRTSGRPEIVVALIDGPVLMENADLWSSNVRHLSSTLSATCTQSSSTACIHGTFVAAILSAKRGSPAPAICPGCTLLVRPIFLEAAEGSLQMPSATPAELAQALVDAINAGARVINLSAALAQPWSRGERDLEQALNLAAARGVITVAAAGNQAALGSSAITRHPWVIPVAGCDSQKRPSGESNLGSSIGRRGLSAPAENITSLGADGKPRTFGGTSAAAPFVTGTLALLWSEFPSASAAQIKSSVAQGTSVRRRAIFPPVLDALTAYQTLAAANRGM